MDLTDKNKQVPVIDNLYLDFNGIIYRCLSVNLAFNLGWLMLPQKQILTSFIRRNLLKSLRIHDVDY